MSRDSRSRLNGKHPFGRDPLSAVNPIGDGVLANSEAGSERHLASGDLNGIVQRGDSGHKHPYNTAGDKNTSTRSDNEVRHSRRMPKFAKTSALWERLTRARLDARPPLSTRQEDIAKEVGVGQTAVSGWKTGDKVPELDKGMVLAKKADICLEFLYTGRGPRRPWGDVTTPLGRLVEVWERLDEMEQSQLLAYAELLQKAGEKAEPTPPMRPVKPAPRSPH